MASLLREILFETAAQGPPPSKDFYQLVITQKEVIWRWWKISVRSEFRGAPPGEIKLLHNDFLNDARLQGHVDYLERLPDKLLLEILSYMSLQDIGHLSQTSSRFRKLCNSEEIWRQAVKGHCDDMITEDMEMLANVMGWKNIFFKKKFLKNSNLDQLCCAMTAKVLNIQVLI
uniref:F-box protein 36a n=1 Tax=Cyprinus carpio TaxID=7962 RepID=A0A8C1VXY4_CYPCA